MSDRDTQWSPGQDEGGGQDQCVPVCLGSLDWIRTENLKLTLWTRRASRRTRACGGGGNTHSNQARACHSLWGRQQKLLLNIKQWGLHVLRATSCIISAVVGVGGDKQHSAPRTSTTNGPEMLQLHADMNGTESLVSGWNGSADTNEGRRESSSHPTSSN